MKESSPFLTTPVAILLGSFIIAIAILIQGGVVKLGGANIAKAPTATAAPNQPSQPAAAPAKVTVSSGHFPLQGTKGAKVQIVEFADFRCPFCEKLFTDVEPQIIKDYVDTGKATFSFRHFAFLGPASIVASNAAECANEQNKFWEFHDYLYQNQPSESDTSMYTTDNMTLAAGKLGLNTDQFRTCLSSNKYQKNVDTDYQEGQTAGVNGTPATFVNGILISGAQPYSAFKQAIDAALK